MAPPSEVPVPLPRQRGQRISPQVWNEQRPRFQKLYVDLDMSLPETMKAMEDTHNFYARYENHAALSLEVITWVVVDLVRLAKSSTRLRSRNGASRSTSTKTRWRIYYERRSGAERKKVKTRYLRSTAAR